MKNKILQSMIRFLAVGAAGANVTQMLERRGFKTYYINLAQQDLDLISSPNKYHIPGGEGASKNRQKAKTVLSQCVEEVVELLEKQIPEQYIFIVYSLAGGTGSGLGAFLAEMFARNPEKKVGLVVILPAMSESLQARVNTYEALSEIMRIKSQLGSIFILDNNQREDKLSINRSFAELFESYINIGSFSSIRGVIDLAEQKTLLETPGVAMIHKITQGGADKLLPTLNQGVYTPIEPNKKVRYIALSQSDKDLVSIESISDVVGEPIDTFCGYGNEVETVLYLAGLSFPKTFIEKLAASIQAEQERAQDVLEDDDIQMDMNFGFLQKNKSSQQKKENQENPKNNMRDMLMQLL